VANEEALLSVYLETYKN